VHAECLIAIPLDLIALVHELGRDLRADSDGGKRITLTEAEALASRLAAVAEDLVRAIARAQS
jgi:hypothetical protein